MICFYALKWIVIYFWHYLKLWLITCNIYYNITLLKELISLSHDATDPRTIQRPVWCWCCLWGSSLIRKLWGHLSLGEIHILSNTWNPYRQHQLNGFKQNCPLQSNQILGRCIYSNNGYLQSLCMVYLIYTISIDSL